MVPQDPSDETVFAPSLGVSASLSGLVTFARLQLNGGAVAGARVAPAGLLAQTLRPATAVADTPSGPEAAAPGWMLSTFDGRLLASAEGGLASGSSATVTLLPDDGVAVIVLANAYPEGAALGGAVARTLTDLAVLGAPQEDWLAREQATLAAERAAVPAAGLVLPPQAPAAAPAPRARDVYAGVYENRYYGRVTVRPDAGDGLVVRLGRGRDPALRALERRHLAGHGVGDGRRLRRARRPGPGRHAHAAHVRRPPRRVRPRRLTPRLYFFFRRPLRTLFMIMPKAIPAMAAPMSSSHALAPVAATRVVISSLPHASVRHQPGRAWSPSRARALVTSSLTSRMPL